MHFYRCGQSRRQKYPPVSTLHSVVSMGSVRCSRDSYLPRKVRLMGQIGFVVKLDKQVWCGWQRSWVPSFPPTTVRYRSSITRGLLNAWVQMVSLSLLSPRIFRGTSDRRGWPHTGASKSRTATCREMSLAWCEACFCMRNHQHFALKIR